MKKKKRNLIKLRLKFNDVTSESKFYPLHFIIMDIINTDMDIIYTVRKLVLFKSAIPLVVKTESFLDITIAPTLFF